MEREISMVNYYDLLEIPQNATEEQIREAIKKCRRTWNNRANNPDGKIRADAEQHVHDIAEAEKVLLDPTQRNKYDYDLAHAPKISSHSNMDDEDELIERAINLADLENYTEAQALLQQVVSHNPQNAQAWYLYGLVCRDLKDTHKAKECFTAATKLEPQNDEFFKELGFSYIDENDGEAAYEAFQQALACKPEEKEYKVYCAECLRVIGRYKEAYQIAQEAIDEGQKDEFATDIYIGICAAYLNSSVSNNKPAGKYLITNEHQLQFAKEMLFKMKSVSCATEDARSSIQRAENMINDAENTRFDSMYGDVKVWIIIAIVLIVIMSAAQLAAVGLIILIAVGFVFYTTHYKVGWKWNYIKSDITVRNSGLQ